MDGEGLFVRVMLQTTHIWPIKRMIHTSKLLQNVTQSPFNFFIFFFFFFNWQSNNLIPKKERSSEGTSCVCLQPSDVRLQVMTAYCIRLHTSSNLATLKCESSYEMITLGSELPSLITLFSIPSESSWCKGSLHTAVSISVLMSCNEFAQKVGGNYAPYAYVGIYKLSKGDWTPLIWVNLH